MPCCLAKNVWRSTDWAVAGLCPWKLGHIQRHNQEAWRPRPLCCGVSCNPERSGGKIDSKTWWHLRSSTGQRTSGGACGKCSNYLRKLSQNISFFPHNGCELKWLALSPFKKETSARRGQQPHCRKNAPVVPSKKLICLMRFLARRSSWKGNHWRYGENLRHHTVRDGAQYLPTSKKITSHTLTWLH